MRRLQLLQISAGLLLRLCRARQPGFSIHHDLLAYPQFEVVFSEAYISEPDAQAILEKTDPAHPSYDAAFSSQTDLLASAGVRSAAPGESEDSREENDDEDADHKVGETYEVMSLPPHRYLCAIPVIEPPPALNETATELAKAEEARELARASAHGWDLMNGLDGTCLYYVSGWWSYSFCYGHDVVQFHALPGSLKTGPPVRDPQTMEYVLGRVQDTTRPASRSQQQQQQQRRGQAGGDNHHNDPQRQGQGQGEHEPEAHGMTPAPPNTELQVKGDQRYLVQRLDAGTICDLTGRERTIEVQYHCSPGSTQDRIGWIKEVTTCAYLMVVHTPRLCSDVAFQPPKETKANPISCRAILSEADEAAWHRRKTLEAEALMTGEEAEGAEAEASVSAPAAQKERAPLVVGGVVVGGRQMLGHGEDGRAPVQLAPPRGFFGGSPLKAPNAGVVGKAKQQQQQQQQQQAGEERVEVVAQGRARGAHAGGDDEGDDVPQVAVLTDEELEELGISPELVEQLQQQLQELAGERGWKLEVVEVPGDPKEIRGVVEYDEDEDEGEGEYVYDEAGEGYGEGYGDGGGEQYYGGEGDEGGDEQQAGSQEQFFHEEL